MRARTDTTCTLSHTHTIRASPSVDMTDNYGRTPLHHAALNGNLEAPCFFEQTCLYTTSIHIILPPHKHGFILLPYKLYYLYTNRVLYYCHRICNNTYFDWSLRNWCFEFITRKCLCAVLSTTSACHKTHIYTLSIHVLISMSLMSTALHTYANL